MDRKDKIQIIMMALICIFLLVLIVAIVVLVKNIDEIKSDPIQYGIDKDFYDSCTCKKNFDTIYFDKDKEPPQYNKQLVIQNQSN